MAEIKRMIELNLLYSVQLFVFCCIWIKDSLFIAKHFRVFKKKCFYRPTSTPPHRKCWPLGETCVLAVAPFEVPTPKNLAKQVLFFAYALE